MDLKTENGELVAKNGDLAIASKEETDKMYAERILLHTPGSFFFNPRLGAGLKKDVASELGGEQLERRINTALNADGFTVHGIQLTASGELAVNATRDEP